MKLEHQVTLTKAFYMQTTEVTEGQWEAVMVSNYSFSVRGLPGCSFLLLYSGVYNKNESARRRNVQAAD